MSRTPLPACRRKSAPLWYILFALPAMNDPLLTELKFRENTVTWNYFMPIFGGEQGWSSGESTCLPPMWPGFKSWCQCHTWVDFVAGSLPWAFREVFLWILKFSPLLTNLHFQNSNSIRNAEIHFNKFSWTPKCSEGKQIAIIVIITKVFEPV